MNESKLLEILAMAITTFAYATSKGGSPIPVTPLLLPFWLLWLPVTTIAGLLLPQLILIDCLAIGLYWRQWQLRLTYHLLFWAMLGMMIGSLTFVWINDAMLKLIIGCLCILFACSHWMTPTTHHSSNSRGKLTIKILEPVWGFACGYASFVIHLGGPFLQFYLLPKRLDKPMLVGTTALIFFIINLAKLPIYIYLGLLSNQVLSTHLIIGLPLSCLGVVLGRSIQRLIPKTQFYQLIYISMALIGILLVADPWL